MPTNVTIEYIKAEGRYGEAKTKEEKIEALEEMISTLPTHKGCDHLRADLKSKLAKLKKSTSKKAKRSGFSIAKQGDAQVCMLGLTQSGKSTLLSKLTNAKPKISNVPYTTSKPEVGMIEWEGVKIQLVEIPSTFSRVYMSIARSCDGILIVVNNEDERKEMRKIVKDFRIKAPIIEVNSRSDIEIEKLKGKIWNVLGLVKVYTKIQGKKAEKRALVLKIGSTVEDAARNLHKDFVKFFRFARIWGKSMTHQGQRVGFEHKLKDGDIIEIHIS